MIAPTISVKNEFSPALARAFSESRERPDLARAVNYIMQLWVSFAIDKIPAAQKSDIRSRLMARATRTAYQLGLNKVVKIKKDGTYRKMDMRYIELRQSLAAHIVWATNYPGRAGTGQAYANKARTRNAKDFYALVGSFVSHRQYSAGYLRSGLLPALNAFRVAQGKGELPTFKKKYGPPGSAIKAQPNDMVPMAQVEDLAKGILIKAPNAFSESLPEIEKQIEGYIADNLAKRALDAGFRVRRG